MRTRQAVAAHVAVGAAQAGTGMLFLNPSSPWGAFGNAVGSAGIQMAIQAGLMALQAWLASRNSNTDPNGNALVQVPGKAFGTPPTYVTVQPPEILPRPIPPPVFATPPAHPRGEPANLGGKRDDIPSGGTSGQVGGTYPGSPYTGRK